MLPYTITMVYSEGPGHCAILLTFIKQDLENHLFTCFDQLYTDSLGSPWKT